MSQIEINSELDGENNQEINTSKETFLAHKKKWEDIKYLISKNIKEIFWEAWIKPLKFEKYDEGTLYLTSDSKIISNRAETQYYETIFLQASIFFKSIKKIQFYTVSVKKKVNTSQKNEAQKNKIQKQYVYNDLSFIDSMSMKTNSKFSFQNFIVGDSNRMPYAASKRICEKNSLAYNPLFIHGDVGMGKTHLLNAMAIDLKENFPYLKIVMMSAERFMYQFIKSIRLKETIKFKDQFRSIDILMIDDIQFIGGKDSTQEEFFYTFNDLISQGKQIIISSNKSPIDLLSLDEKLKSRLSGGLVVDFLPTNYKLRLEILKKKVEVLNIRIPIDVLEFIASKIVNNIRELEGALNRIWANYELTGKKINIENSTNLLSDLISAREKNISIYSIQKKVSSYYNLSLSDMTSSRRSINIARPRQIAMFLCKGLTSYSYPEIGKAFGGKDHTTVLHAVKKIQSMIESDQKLKIHISDLKETIFTQ